MMADLVDQYVADEMLERLALLGPFGKDRLAEQADPVGQGAARFRRCAGRSGCLHRRRSGRADARSPSRRAAHRRQIRRPAARHRRDGRRTAPAAARIASRAIASISSAEGGWSKRRAMARRHRGLNARAASLPHGDCLSTWPPFQSMRSGGRVVEGARLESEYTAKPYRGFESLPLRQLPHFSTPPGAMRCIRCLAVTLRLSRPSRRPGFGPLRSDARHLRHQARR